MKTKYILPILVAISLHSCIEETKLDTNNLVLNTFFSDSIPLSVRTFKTLSVFDATKYQQVNDATVTLYEEEKLLGNLTYRQKQGQDDKGIAVSIPQGFGLDKFTPKAGKTYRVEVEHQGKKLVAQDVMPKKVDFEATNPKDVGQSIQYDITINDPKEEKNYYVLTYNITDFITNPENNTTSEWTQASGAMKSDDPAIEFAYHHQGLIASGYRFAFSDRTFDGKTYALPVRFDIHHKGPDKQRLNIYLMSVSKVYYDYIRTVYQQQQNNKDFYAEPTQVSNNVSNGFGVFAGFTFAKKQFYFGSK